LTSGNYYSLVVCTICGAVYDVRMPGQVRCMNLAECSVTGRKLKALGEFIRSRPTKNDMMLVPVQRHLYSRPKPEGEPF
jgi:hypothetical protein